MTFNLMTQKIENLCRVGAMIITAPLWLPFYLYHCAMLWREDHHD